ncbi:MAG: HDOD domain-containing protein [Planctomycetota bacterium]
MDAPAQYLAIMASDNLPSPSALALELIELTRQPEVDMAAITRIVASDPAICARAIRAANASTVGARKVSSVEQAVRLLGLRGIARVAVGVSMVDRYRGGLVEFDYAAYWAESLGRAVAAQVLALETRFGQADEAFTYGLLADIGRLALVTVHPVRYGEMLLTLGSTDPGELAEAELALFDIDVGLLSALMLREWGMPALHAALARDAGPEPTATARDARLLEICRAAGLVANLLVTQQVCRTQLAAVMKALAEIGIGVDHAAEAFPDIVAAWRECGASFDVRVRPVGALAELYATATGGVTNAAPASCQP